MSSFEREKETICHMLELNDYGIRDGIMPLDDFRLFLTPPGFDVESEEVFKIKGNDIVCCGSVIILGGEMRDAFFKQDKDERDKFSKSLEKENGVDKLDFFEMDDDGKDFKISIRSEFPITKLSEGVFADAMDRLNLAGGSIEDAINEYFEKLL